MPASNIILEQFCMVFNICCRFQVLNLDSDHDHDDELDMKFALCYGYIANIL